MDGIFSEFYYNLFDFLKLLSVYYYIFSMSLLLKFEDDYGEIR